MITDQNQARKANTYQNMKHRSEALNLLRKHMGTKQSQGEDTDTYFDNFEIIASDRKTVFFNILTLFIDVFLYVGFLFLFFNPETAFWTLVFALSGPTVIMFYLALVKIIDIVIITRRIRKRVKETGHTKSDWIDTYIE